jgi:hypothetical protein
MVLIISHPVVMIRLPHYLKDFTEIKRRGMYTESCGKYLISTHVGPALPLHYVKLYPNATYSNKNGSTCNKIQIKQKKLRGPSPRTNYADRATGSCRRS